VAAINRYQKILNN